MKCNGNSTEHKTSQDAGVFTDTTFKHENSNKKTVILIITNSIYTAASTQRI